LFTLHNFQKEIQNSLFKAWGTYQNALVVSPTGSGKTVLFCDTINKLTAPVCAIAHRQELIGQMSLALAKYGIRHRIIGPSSLIRIINQLHVYVLGKSFYNPDSDIAVAGIRTLIRRADQYKHYFSRVQYWILDEAHHLQRNNEWGRGVELFTHPNIKGLGVTATPCRADGGGLGRHADGLFDHMIIGPNGRELIEQGFLSKYRIFAPLCDADFASLKISKNTNDYVQEELKRVTRNSSIIGDIIGEYKKYAMGKLGVTFVPGIEIGHDVAEQFRLAGVPAIMVTGETPDTERAKIQKRFANREILQMINVGLFGEGYDLPALEVVSMASRTESFSKYSQEFGRVLRTMEGKEHGLIIDHVGNVMRHGLPDVRREWTLDRRDRRKQDKDPDKIPVRTCDKCTAIYESFNRTCPYCGYEYVPADRSSPDMVEGDLTELDETVLAAMRGEISKIDAPDSIVKNSLLRAGAGDIVAMSAAKNHRLRRGAQAILREFIAQWAGYHREAGREDREIYKRFYHRFGMDIMKAQTLGKSDAHALTISISKQMGL
jgi:superfamily II DNA or RNA helicase